MEQLLFLKGFRLFPDVKGIVCDDSRAIAHAFAADCDHDQICPGIYGRELMADTPRAHGSITSLFENIKPGQGDAIVLVGIRNL